MKKILEEHRINYEKKIVSLSRRLTKPNLSVIDKKDLQRKRQETLLLIEQIEMLQHEIDKQVANESNEKQLELFERYAKQTHLV